MAASKPVACWASECLATITDAQRWVGLKTLVLIERERIVGDTTSREQAFYISSRPADAQPLGSAARSHWGIENSCHWVIDITFNEDQSRVRRKVIRAGLSDDYRLQVLGRTA